VSESAYYLWVEEKPWHRHERGWGEADKGPKNVLMPLQSKTIDDATREAVAWLDNYALQENVYLDLKHAIIYRFEINVTMLYEKDKDRRHIEIATNRKKEELKKAEAEVARLKKELGEG